MGNLLSLHYWFSSYPGPWLEGSLKAIYIAFGLVIILGLIAWLFEGKNKDNFLMQKFWRRVKNCFLTIGIIGLLLVGARHQRVNFLSMPFFLLIDVASGIAWLYFIAKYILKVVPKRKKEIEEKKEREKYLR
jgi:hypothetical protein